MNIGLECKLPVLDNRRYNSGFNHHTDLPANPIKRKGVNIEVILYCKVSSTLTSPITPSTPNNRSTHSLFSLVESDIHRMTNTAISAVMKVTKEKHMKDIKIMNKKFDMFQVTAVKGVIEALTGDQSMLATKINLNAKIENSITTMDTIKQLIIDTAKTNQTNPQ